MKKLLLSSVICSALLSINASASMKSASSFKFVGDTEYAELCQAAATNDIDLFKTNVKQHGFRLGVSQSKMLNMLANENDFQCAGKGLVSFSQSRGSKEVASYLAGTSAKAETVSTSKYKFIGDKNYKNFCKSAVTDNVNLFRRAVNGQIGSLGVSKQEVINKVLTEDNVTCSGQGLTEFFEQRQATSVLGYIAESLAN